MIAELVLTTLLLKAPSVACTSGDAATGTAELRASVESGALFKLAHKALGAPTACSFSSGGEGRLTLTERFKDGSTLVTENSPPENLEAVLTSSTPLPLPVVTRALAHWAKELDIDLRALREAAPDGGPEGTRVVRRSRAEGVNARIEFELRGAAVNRVRVAIAL